MLRRQFLISCAATLATLGSEQLALAEQEDNDRTLYIQPLGKAMPDADVRFVEKALKSFYAVKVKLLPRVDLPKSAYYRPRNRYRAEKLLDFLEPRLPKHGYRILGLTSSDISTTKGKIKDWGILGLGTLDGRMCVLSSFRCKRQSKGAEHARVRLGKVAVHEIGHTFGLDHCTNHGCLMEDGKGSVLTTDHEFDLCTDCRLELARAGHELSKSPDAPWPKPKGK